MRRKVLVTGAAGYVARHIIPTLGRESDLRLLDIREIDPALGGDQVRADITSYEAMLDACAGIDTVVHLAAEPSLHASFEQLLQPNLVGVYNMFEAARQLGCSRVVFASSINTIMAYPQGFGITPDMPVNPSNVYGAAKCFGEALARHYANLGLSSICVRIGQIREMTDSFETEPGEEYDGAWISTRDLAGLFESCVSAENIEFEVVHGQSLHARPRMSIESTCAVLGYTPRDDTR